MDGLCPPEPKRQCRSRKHSLLSIISVGLPCEVLDKAIAESLGRAGDAAGEVGMR
jgi:hypothetical protein